MKINKTYTKEHGCELRDVAGARRCVRVPHVDIGGKHTERIVCYFGDDSETVSIRFPYKYGWNTEDAEIVAKEYSEACSGTFHKATMPVDESVLPSAVDAIRLHSIAHEIVDGELHDIALKFMSMTEQPHIVTDELDSNVEDDLPELPPFIVVAENVINAVGASIYNNDESMILASEKKYDELLPDDIAGINILASGSVNSDTRVPVYDLMLVRRDGAGIEYPLSSIVVGEHVETGCFRKSGAYKFPLFAQKISDRYALIQVHKMGDEVKLFDQSGKQPIGYAEDIDKFVAMESPHDAMFMCIGITNKLYAYDVFHFDGQELTLVPLAERLELLDSVDDNIKVIDAVEVSTRDELFDLESGSYLVRHTNEVIMDVLRPFWFFYDAGAIKPNQPIRSLLPEVVDEIDDECITHAMTSDGVYAQIHNSKHGLSLFVGDGARDRSREFSDIVSAFDNIEENLIIECIIACNDQDGLPKSQETIYRDNMSGCQSTAYCFDIAFYNEDLSSQERDKREEILSKLLTKLDSRVISLYCEDGPEVWGWENSTRKTIKKITKV